MATTIIKSFNSDNQAEVTSDNALKVTGNISATNPSVGTNGDPSPDSSTAIGAEDPSGNLQPLKVNSEGKLLVTAEQVFETQDVIVVFNEEAAVPVGLQTTINTYTAPVGKISYLLSIFNSGGNRAEYQIYNNGSLFDKQYSNVTQLSTPFDYKTGSSTVPGMVIPVGNVLEVKVINSGTDPTSFNSRLLILEVT